MNISSANIAYHLTSNMTKPNKIMKTRILPFFLEHNVKYILDFGCGKYLRDSLLLTENGLSVDAVDLQEQIERIDSEKSKLVHCLSSKTTNSNYDAVLLNYIIQVLPTIEQRQDVLTKGYDSLKPGGYFVLSVRNQRDMRHCVESRGVPFNDGFLMGKGKQFTFVKGYEPAEIENLLDSFDLKLLQLHKTPDSYIVLSQK